MHFAESSRQQCQVLVDVRVGLKFFINTPKFFTKQEPGPRCIHSIAGENKKNKTKEEEEEEEEEEDKEDLLCSSFTEPFAMLSLPQHVKISTRTELHDYAGEFVCLEVSIQRWQERVV